MSKYAVCTTWEHFFLNHEGRETLRPVRFVGDLETNKIIYAEIDWGLEQFECASVEEVADLEDSVINANDAFRNAEEFEIEMTDDLPAWVPEDRIIKSQGLTNF